MTKDEQSSDDLIERAKKAIEQWRTIQLNLEMEKLIKDHEKFEIDFELAKRTLNDYHKVKKQQKFRFWLSVVISLIAVAVASYSLWLQLRTSQLQPMIIKPQDTVHKIAPFHYLKNPKKTDSVK